MPTQVTARALSTSYRGRLVPDSLTCAHAAGERAGVVGRSSSGKSSPLRLPAGGEVVLRAGGGVGHLPQEGRLPLHRTLDHALSDLRALESRTRALETALTAGEDSALTEYGELLTAFGPRGGYQADARVDRAPHGLGPAGPPRDRRTGTRSGGEQVRPRLAGVLAAAPEAPFPDEPMNHPDAAAPTWLEDHLRTRRGTTVVVSHDRAFLERVATTLLGVDADRRAVARHGCGYAGHLAEKAAARERRARARDRRQAEDAASREGAATTALGATGPAVDGRPSPVDLTSEAGRYPLVTGEIGTGEGTLLRALAGRLAPHGGRAVRRGSTGHPPQDPVPGRPGTTVPGARARGLPRTLEEHAERLLALGPSTRGLPRRPRQRPLTRPRRGTGGGPDRLLPPLVPVSHDRRPSERRQGDRLTLPDRDRGPVPSG